MDWQSLMAGLDAWLWQSPYLDVPNYAWISAGLGLIVLALYLFLILTGPAEEEDDATAEAETAEAAQTEEAAPPEPESAVPDEAVPEPAKETASEAEAPAPEPAEAQAPEPTPEPELEPTPPEPEPAKDSSAPAAEAAVPVEEEPEEEAPVPDGAEPETVEPEEVELVPPEGWLKRLRSGLSKTQDKLTKGIERALSGGKIDDDLMEELEEVLITSDLGVETSMKLLEKLEEEIDRKSLDDPGKLKDWIREEMVSILSAVDKPLTIPDGHQGPYVIMVTGVNGTGKTTTIGKLAMRFRREGKSVMLGAADTFRAAAIQQLEEWARRSAVPIIKHKEGADPAAVAYDTVKAAEARGAEVVIIDTAGRLHTKVNLMEELKKVKRITGRELPGAPHETLLVLDATTGQNAVQQAKMFNEAIEITGLVMTKLDGTAKGGIIVAVSDEFKIPIRFIGVGEKIYDLQPFKAEEFVDALF